MQNSRGSRGRFLDLAGHLLLKLGDHDRAVLYYREALDASPTDAMDHFNLGFACQAAGRLNDAENLYIKSVFSAYGP